jgi:hypothetical protein
MKQYYFWIRKVIYSNTRLTLFYHNQLRQFEYMGSQGLFQDDPIPLAFLSSNKYIISFEFCIILKHAFCRLELCILIFSVG